MTDPNPNSYTPLTSGQQNFNWQHMGNPEGFIGSGVGILASGEANFADFDSQIPQEVSGISSTYPHASDDFTARVGDLVEHYDQSGIYKTYPANSGKIEKISDENVAPTGIHNSFLAPEDLETPHSQGKSFKQGTITLGGVKFFKTRRRADYAEGQLSPHNETDFMGIGDFSVFNPAIHIYPLTGVVQGILDPLGAFVQIDYAATNGFEDFGKSFPNEPYNTIHREPFDSNIANLHQEIIYRTIFKEGKVVGKVALARDNPPSGETRTNEDTGEPQYAVAPQMLEPVDFTGVPEPATEEQASTEDAFKVEPIIEEDFSKDFVRLVGQTCRKKWSKGSAEARVNPTSDFKDNLGRITTEYIVDESNNEVYGNWKNIHPQGTDRTNVGGTAVTEERWAMLIRGKNIAYKHTYGCWAEYTPYGDSIGAQAMSLVSVDVKRVRKLLQYGIGKTMGYISYHDAAFAQENNLFEFTREQDGFNRVNRYHGTFPGGGHDTNKYGGWSCFMVDNPKAAIPAWANKNSFTVGFEGNNPPARWPGGSGPNANVVEVDVDFIYRVGDEPGTARANPDDLVDPETLDPTAGNLIIMKRVFIYQPRL